MPIKKQKYKRKSKKINLKGYFSNLTLGILTLVVFGFLSSGINRFFFNSGVDANYPDLSTLITKTKYEKKTGHKIQIEIRNGCGVSNLARMYTDFLREKGLDVLLTDIKRIPANSVDPTIKNYHWLDLVNGMLNAYEQGHHTALLVDENNNVTEGPGFNIFCVDQTGIITPDLGVLEGITRQTVFDLANELGVKISKKSISIEKLKTAKELFATSTAGGIMPITKISGETIGSGKVGDVTRQIHKLYWQKHLDSNWTISVNDILK